MRLANQNTPYESCYTTGCFWLYILLLCSYFKEPVFSPASNIVHTRLNLSMGISSIGLPFRLSLTTFVVLLWQRNLQKGVLYSFHECFVLLFCTFNVCPCSVFYFVVFFCLRRRRGFSSSLSGTQPKILDMRRFYCKNRRPYVERLTVPMP